MECCENVVLELGSPGLEARRGLVSLHRLGKSLTLPEPWAVHLSDGQDRGEGHEYWQVPEPRNWYVSDTHSAVAVI